MIKMPLNLQQALCVNRKNRRIEVLMRGGLGNQLFCYAAGKELSARTGLSLHLVTRNYSLSNDEKRSFELMRILPKDVSFGDDSVVKKVWTERTFHFNAEFDSLSKPVLLDGYFQSPKYFSLVSGNLVQELSASLDRLVPDATRPASRYIAVHVRRGDYLNDEVKKTHGIVPFEYFQQGVRSLREALGKLPVLVFSDDVAEAFRLASEIDDADVFDPEESRTSHQTLRALSQSAGICISNSTFGWWAAYLNADRPVVAPKPWFVNQSVNTADLYLPAWTPIGYRPPQ